MNSTPQKKTRRSSTVVKRYQSRSCFAAHPVGKTNLRRLRANRRETRHWPERRDTCDWRKIRKLPVGQTGHHRRTVIGGGGNRRSHRWRRQRQHQQQQVRRPKKNIFGGSEARSSDWRDLDTSVSLCPRLSQPRRDTSAVTRRIQRPRRLVTMETGRAQWLRLI